MGWPLETYTNMNITYERGRRFLLVTDGACLGNPGPGGWGVVIHELDGDTIVSRYALAGSADGNTTNNRMELTAAYEGLKFIGGTSTPIVIVSDSQLLVKGMTQWIDGWKQRGWRGSDRKTIKNTDLWMALDELTLGREVYWEWTRGHYGHALNETADMLATNAAAGVYGGQPAVTLRAMHPQLFSEALVS
jgi:ribonuclease HI